jgi:hypothetical protein
MVGTTICAGREWFAVLQLIPTRAIVLNLLLSSAVAATPSSDLWCESSSRDCLVYFQKMHLHFEDTD